MGLDRRPDGSLACTPIAGDASLAHGTRRVRSSAAQSVGCEDAQDLIEDFERALDRISA